MTTAADFVEAIRDDPDDEALRLVFADWLEERDDPRGEFLRIQVELARWVPDLARRHHLQERERELLARHAAEWLGPLAQAVRSWRFEGGLCRVTMTARRFVSARFAANAVALFRQGWVTAVRLEQAANRMSQLAQAPHLAEVTELDLSSNNLSDKAVRYLVDSRHLKRLKRVDLGNNHLSEQSAYLLSTSSLFRRLLELDIRNNRLGDRGVRELLGFLPRLLLGRLDVQGSAWRPQTRRELSDWHASRTDASADRVVNVLGMEFVRIPAGTFLMGSPDTEPHRYEDEGPLHPVTISRPFYYSVYPVTQQAYVEVMGSNPSFFHDINTNGGPDHPVDSVSWEDAVEFCRRLSQIPEEKAAGRVYRLPTEAEWEHACRAGTETPFWWGDTASSRQANFDGNHPYDGGEEGPFLNRTSQVGSYEANPFGLMDMHGNIWEWVADWYDRGYYAVSPSSDPLGPPESDSHVLRGGCWQHLGACSRSAYRLDHAPGGHYQGFRVVLM